MRAQQGTDTRERLLDAAARLFAQRGYSATSVAAIGQAAGMSRGLVNFHFRTKENLLRAVIEDLVADLELHMFPADMSTEPPLTALATLVEAHRQFLVEQPDRARLLFRLQAEELNPALGLRDFAQLHERWLSRTRPWWDAALTTGEVDPALDHNAVATFTIGALRGIALEWLLAPEAVNIDLAYAQLLRSLRLGLAPLTE